jgi:hypothetical protein
MMDSRYAIYFVPAADTALYRFGAAVLGFDCFTGADIPTLDARPVDACAWHELTHEPRRYGSVTGQRPQCAIRQQTGLAASKLRVTPPKIHSPRRVCP